MRASRLFPILLVAVTALSCADTGFDPGLDEPGPGELPDLSGLPVAQSVLDAAPMEMCGEPTETGLMLGPDLATGSVTVTNDAENLYVTYRSDAGRPILATALFVGDDPADIPVTRWGTPRLLRFPYVSGHGFETFEVVWEVPLDEVSGPEAVIAAFGQIGFLPSWGDGQPITPGRDWAMYFTHTVATCGGGPIGPGGGSVSSPDGRAIIDVPAGALTEDVTITVEPATFEEVEARVDEILGGEGSMNAPASDATESTLALLGGAIRPIANTFWDFGPDGLEFLESATVTLTYSDDDLPPDVPEEELGVFIINGVIPFERIGVVDPVANTITAPVDHFSFFFVGYLEVQATDITVLGGTAINDGIPVGTEIEYVASVSNFGPGDVDQVDVLYEVTGPVALGEVDEACEAVVDPSPATVAVLCDAGPIDAGEGVAAPPIDFTVTGPGDVVIRVTPSFIGVDTNPVNDWHEQEFRAGRIADLQATATVSNNGEPVGAEVRFDGAISNFGPESVEGATISYEAFGNVVLGTIDEGCVVDPAPIFADILVRCDVGAISVDDIAQAPSAAFIAQEPGEYTVWSRSSFPGTDPDPSNNRFDYVFTAVDGTPQADLSVTSATESADPIEVGLGATYQATLENLGPDAAPQASVIYSAFGDIEAGTLGTNCTLSAIPIIADVEVRCEVGELAAFASAQASPVEFIPGSTGEYTIWMSPGSTGTVDPDLDNNRIEETVTVTGRTVDLEIQDLREQEDPVPEGSPVQYNVNVALDQAAQPLQGATVTLGHQGNATFVSASDDACVESPLIPAVVCEIDNIFDGQILSYGIVLQPNDGLTQLVVTAQVDAPFPVVDIDDTNDFQSEVTTITPEGGTGEADLSVVSATESADPIEVGLGVTYQATIQNLGPDGVSDARVFYSGFGDIEAGTLGADCTLSAIPLVADVEVICEVGALAASTSAQAPPVEFIPASTGEFTIWMSPGAPSADDPNLDNNRLEQTVTVVGRTADLGIQDLREQNDPVPAGSPIQYNINIDLDGAAQPVEGAFFRINHGGDATFVSGSDPSCAPEPITPAVRCEIDTILDGQILSYAVTLQPNVGLTELRVEAEARLPAGVVTDTDNSNNNAFEITTITDDGGTVDGVDLAVTAFDVPAGPLGLGEVGTVQATIENRGTDPATDAIVFYTFPATATIESVSSPCQESTNPLFGAVEVRCSYASVASGATVGVPPVGVSFDAPGDASVGVQLFQSADVDATNNTAQGTIEVPQPLADLRIDRLVDSPDPVQPGDLVTYEIDVTASGGTTVPDGRLVLEFTGDANYVGSSVSCGVGPGANTRTCVLDPLVPGVTQTIQADFILTTGGQTVTLDATLESLGLIQDPDESNNTATTTTQVESVPPTPLVIGDVVERVLPGTGTTAFTFDGTVGDPVRVAVAVTSGGNAAADFWITDEVGDILASEDDPIRAQGFWSQNIDLVLPRSGTFTVWIDGLGSGTFRLGLGTGVGRIDTSYGPPLSSYLRIIDPGRTFLSMELENDGLVVLGPETLGRIDANGEVATGFGSAGIVDLEPILGGPAGAMAVQPDGRIVVAGLDGGIPYPWTVARFLPDGSLDPSFGAGGVATVQVGTTNVSTQVRPLGIGFQQNGAELDIVVAGRSASPTQRIGLTRLNPDGSLDTGFGTGGVVLDGSFEPTYAAIQPDGRILVGSATQLRRWTTTGAPDAGFGSGGLANLPAAGVLRVVPLGGGDIVGVGEQGDDGVVVRLTSSGAPAAFGSGGATFLNFGLPMRLRGVTEDAQGRLVVVGDEEQVDNGDFFDQIVIRLESGGQLDSTFGHSGFTVVGTDIDKGRDVVIDSQGRILVGGEIGSNRGWQFTRQLVN